MALADLFQDVVEAQPEGWASFAVEVDVRGLMDAVGGVDCRDEARREARRALALCGAQIDGGSGPLRLRVSATPERSDSPAVVMHALRRLDDRRVVGDITIREG